VKRCESILDVRKDVRIIQEVINQHMYQLIHHWVLLVNVSLIMIPIYLIAPVIINIHDDYVFVFKCTHSFVNVYSY
jgi:hypothetical protein